MLRSVTRTALCATALAIPAGSAFADPPPYRPAYVIESPDAPENSIPLDQEPEQVPVDDQVIVEPPLDDGVGEPPPEQPGFENLTPPEVPPPQGNVPDDDPRALQEFGPTLDPYGTWIDDPTYGQLWIPNPAYVGAGFSPYLTGGHWALDAYGNWFWVSDYAFGGIVFHYGRWVYGQRGWGWIPGYRYAPAWVSWRIPNGGSAYLGWAPTPPSFVWSHGSAISVSGRLPYFWVFCPSAQAFGRSPSQSVVRNTADARAIARGTRSYVPRPSATVFGPSMQVARVPRSAWPSVRMQPVGMRPGLSPAARGFVAPAHGRGRGR